MIGNLSPPLHDELFALSRIRERLILFFYLVLSKSGKKVAVCLLKSKGKRWFGEQRVHVCCSFSHSVLKNRFVVFNYALTNAFDFTYVHVVHAQTNENVKQTISGPIRRRFIRSAQLINRIDYSTNHFCGFVCGLIQNFNVFFKYFSQVILRTLTFNYVRKGVKTGKVENYWAKSRVFTPWLGKKGGRKLKVNN